jgi:PTS system glucose-specific IIA component
VLGLFKSKKFPIYSPVKGVSVDVQGVNDEVFSQLMLGDGVAISPSTGEFCAPFDGIVSKLFATHHAFAVKHKSGVEVIVHIGLDTVELGGEGFEAMVEEGDTVETGQLIIRADLSIIKRAGKERITPIIVHRESNVRIIHKSFNRVDRGDLLMEVR